MREPVEFSVPVDWGVQLEKWTAERGPEWRAALDKWLDCRPPVWGRTMKWSRERVYELVHLWNDQNEAATAICLWWVQRGYLPRKDVPKKGLIGNGHVGVISGPVGRMQDMGILERRETYTEERVRNAVLGKRKPTETQSNKPVSRLAEILEMRRQRVQLSGGSFDSLTREERGMPSAEIAQQQHPDYPQGVSYDAAYRIENGRTTLFTVDDNKRLGTLRRVLNMMETLDKGVPTLAEYNNLKASQKDLIQLRLRKTMPAIRAAAAFLETLFETELSYDSPNQSSENMLNLD